MKKLMFAAAAIAAGVALADVTSDNVVGYNTTDNTAGDASFIFGASFNAVNGNGVPFNSLICPEEFEDDDQIQTAYTDERGLTQMHIFFYFGEWLDEEYNPIAEDEGLPLGGSAWFISSSGTAKTLTTSGEVRKTNFIHTFTEPSSLITSAFPMPFCPNSENCSWGCSDDTQLQTAYIDERGLTQMHIFFYFGEWMDEEYNTIAADAVVASPGQGFWIILQDQGDTFSEVSPIK